MSYTSMELAEVFIRTGELDDALEALAEQLTASPDDAEARRLRASVLLRLPTEDNLAGALADINSLAQPNASDFVQRSIIYEKQGELKEAIADTRKALKASADDDKARLHERLLELLLKSENYDEALAEIRSQPRTFIWLEREADVLAQMGDDMLATARYGLVLSKMQDTFDIEQNPHHRAMMARVLMARADAYFRAEHFDLAIEHYEHAKTLSDDPTIAFNLGLIALLKNDKDRAIQLCENALAHASKFVREQMLNDLTDERFAELKHSLIKRILKQPGLCFV